MKRCAIDARYSSDLQRETSIDDQVRLCREYAERQGWEVTATLKDRALSGSSVENRPGYQMLMAAALAVSPPLDVIRPSGRPVLSGKRHKSRLAHRSRLGAGPHLRSSTRREA